MGQIFRAYHPTLERDVAIKRIHLDKTDDPALVERFRREARVVAALRHPGIVQIFDFDVEDDQLYMVMEYVPGESLAQRLDAIQAQGGRLPLPEALRIFRAVLQAVAYAHREGVVHCDLKPGNILLDTTDRPILTDFGIAKFLSGERLTLTGDILGTPHYMAPEQAAGGSIGTYTDVYSLGVILYELTTGALPFVGDTAMNIVFKHVNEPPPPPQALNPNLPDALVDIIETALAKSPADRFRSAQEMLVALDRFLSTTDLRSVLQEAPVCFHICYQPHTTPDETLARQIQEALQARGHIACVHSKVKVSNTSASNGDRHIQDSDIFIVLLSDASAHSEMVRAEIERAHRYQQAIGAPHIIPVRLNYDGLLPYVLPALAEPVRYVDWHSPADTPRVIEDILRAISGYLPQQVASARVSAPYETSILSEDGRLIPPSETTSPPLPAFDPRFLKELSAPGGAVKLRDRFYIERPADAQLRDEITRWGTTTTIRAPRQTGKTSLLMRGLHYARQQNAEVVFLDVQSLGSEQLASLDLFLRELAVTFCDELELDDSLVEEAWEGARSPTKKLTRLVEKFILPEFDTPIVLAMDEADSLLQTDFYQDFFGLLRSWHNRRASRPIWEKLNIVLVISTEPYLLIDDIHQSPFNVGLHLTLADFDEAQVRELNRRHGNPVGERDLPDMNYLLGGHPYLTRLALYHMVITGTSWAELRAVAHTEAGPFADHLRHQYWILHDRRDLRNALKGIIANRRCNDEQALFRLLQAGLIKGSGDVYTCRCDLYRLYFEDKLF